MLFIGNSFICENAWVLTSDEPMPSKGPIGGDCHGRMVIWHAFYVDMAKM